MAPRTSRQVAGVLILLISLAVAVWTGVVVSEDHSESTFRDSPGKIPIINFVIGVIAFLTAVSCFMRLLCCKVGSGLNLGVSLFTLVLTAGAFGSLAYFWFHDISSDERTYYKDHKTDYYRLTLGQVVYACLYIVIVLLQLIGSFVRCCGCSECCRNDLYDLDDENPVFFA